VVQKKIQDALAANGYPSNQPIDIIAHSMGGLAARFLVEHPGADVDYWNSNGWYGDGVADVRTDWASRVDDLIMIGTPNNGTWIGWVGSKLPSFVQWNTSAGDMAPNSLFLSKMGYAEKAGEQYTTIGGNPSYLQFLKWDFNGDGIKHGFDGVVPAESPFLAGSDFSMVAENHSGQVGADATLAIVMNTLGYVKNQTGVGHANLAGTASIRLERAHIVQDHDFGTTDDYRFEVWIDPDGGNNSYQHASTIAQAFDGPLDKVWGDTGPSSVGINLPGTSPVMDVKLVVWEDDGSFGKETVSTAFFTNITLSEDIDGMDYYQATAPDAKGGTNTFRISMNGATSNVGRTKLLEFGFDKAYVKKTLELSGNAEAQFTLNAGRDGFAGTFYRGQPDTNTHYSRAANTWVTMGVDKTNTGATQPKLIWRGRILESANWRFNAEYFDDDGGWSFRDSGGKYQFSGAVSSLVAGRTNLSSTSLSAWNVNLYIDNLG